MGVTGLTRFVGNNNLLRFLKEMYPSVLLIFFTTFSLLHPKIIDKLLVMIKSEVKFRLDGNHTTKIHFKHPLKQKLNLRNTF